jgi:hypothetical protein
MKSKRMRALLLAGAAGMLMLSLAGPASVAAGVYSGTITQSVS